MLTVPSRVAKNTNRSSLNTRTGNTACTFSPSSSGIQFTSEDKDAYPSLSPQFETTVPGLYVTGFASTRDFFGMATDPESRDVIRADGVRRDSIAVEDLPLSLAGCAAA